MMVGFTVNVRHIYGDKKQLNSEQKSLRRIAVLILRIIMKIDSFTGYFTMTANPLAGGVFIIP